MVRAESTLALGLAVANRRWAWARAKAAKRHTVVGLTVRTWMARGIGHRSSDARC